MAGIIVVTHGTLGDSLVDCVRHVLGKVPHNLMVLSIRSVDDLQRKEAEGRALIAHLDQGDGVLLLADLFGATPSNLAQRLCRPPRVRGVAGVNLPMLLKVLSYQDRPLAELATLALEGGRECIVSMDLDSEGHGHATGCTD